MLRPAAAVLCGAILAGCASPGLTRMRNDIARSVPEASIGEGWSMGFGPLSMAVARRFASDEAMAEGLDLRDVRAVRVASYPVRGSFDPARVSTPAAIRRLERRGWTVAVRAREADSVTWVLYRHREDRITDLLTASLEAEELTLVHVSGALERVIRGVVAQHGIPGLLGNRATAMADGE